jgi:hemolysin III
MYYGERLNGYTHLAGSVLALGGAAMLVSAAAEKGDALRLASVSIYAATLFVVYLSSTVYHSTRGPLKELFRKLDHTSIYLLIAGSYTPFALVSLKGTAGWTLFAATWTLALIGILQEIWVAKGRRLTSIAIYVIMGWMGLVVMEPLVRALTWDGFTLLLAAGGVYTAGLVFYLFDERFRHWHGLWHLCVMGGSALHFAAVLKFVV